MNSTASPRIESAIREYLAPLLRADGFSGSGRTFRRVVEGWIHVVDIQGSRYGGQFAVNLAVHPLAIPDVMGNTPDPKMLPEALCEFRRRMAESKEHQDLWWKHEATIESMASAVKEAASTYVSTGRSLLSDATSKEADLNTVTSEAFAAGRYDFLGFGSTNCRTAFALARLRDAQGLKAESIAFAKHALEHVGSAISLRAQIQAFMGKHGA